MSSDGRILHLVRSGTWPDELREARGEETVVVLSGLVAPGECSARVVDSAAGAGALLDLIFDHEIVLTW